MIKESSLRLGCEYWKISTFHMWHSPDANRHQTQEATKIKQQRAALISTPAESGKRECRMEDFTSGGAKWGFLYDDVV